MTAFVQVLISLRQHVRRSVLAIRISTTLAVAAASASEGPVRTIIDICRPELLLSRILQRLILPDPRTVQRWSELIVQSRAQRTFILRGCSRTAVKRLSGRCHRARAQKGAAKASAGHSETDAGRKVEFHHSDFFPELRHRSSTVFTAPIRVHATRMLAAEHLSQWSEPR